MRIGINCFLLQPEIGGLKQYFTGLIRCLRKQKDHSFVFFYFKENVEELAKILPLNSDNSVFLRRQGEIKKHLHLIDVFFCPFGSLYPRPLPLPTVVTLVDIQEVFLPHFFSAKNLLDRSFHYKGSTLMADQVITISQFSKETIMKHHEVPAEKITVSHLFADKRFCNPQTALLELQTDNRIPDSFILYPANFWWHKNHDALFQALVWLKNNEKLSVNVVLTGYEKKNGYPLKQKIEEYGLNEAIYLIGYVSVEELVYLYSKAKFLVFPSLFEGFGIPLVEAMACGCPVLTARTSSLPEVGEDSVWYFDPSSPEELGRKIKIMIEDEKLRKRLIALGVIRAKKFSVEKMAEKHIDAFQKAMKNYSHKRYLYNKFYIYLQYIQLYVKKIAVSITSCLEKVGHKHLK